MRQCIGGYPTEDSYFEGLADWKEMQYNNSVVDEVISEIYSAVPNATNHQIFTAWCFHSYPLIDILWFCEENNRLPNYTDRGIMEKKYLERQEKEMTQDAF